MPPRLAARGFPFGPNMRMRLVLGKPVAADSASNPIVAFTTSRNWPRAISMSPSRMFLYGFLNQRRAERGIGVSASGHRLPKTACQWHHVSPMASMLAVWFRKWRGLSGSIFRPKRLREDDVFVLSTLVPAQKKHHQLGAIEPEIHSVPGAVIDASLLNARPDRPYVWLQPSREFADSRIDPCRRLWVRQPFEPLIEGRDAGHSPIGACLGP